MPFPATTALYAGILGLMAIALAFPAGSLRGKKKISIGDGGDMDLLLAIRRHGNFTEWVPITLILIGLLEMGGVSNTVIHVLGAGLVVCRISHAAALNAPSAKTRRLRASCIKMTCSCGPSIHTSCRPGT